MYRLPFSNMSISINDLVPTPVRPSLFLSVTLKPCSYQYYFLILFDWGLPEIFESKFYFLFLSSRLINHSGFLGYYFPSCVYNLYNLLYALYLHTKVLFFLLSSSSSNFKNFSMKDVSHVNCTQVHVTVRSVLVWVICAILNANCQLLFFVLVLVYAV